MSLTATEQQIQEKQKQLLEQGYSLEGIQDGYADLLIKGKALADEEEKLQEYNSKLILLK